MSYVGLSWAVTASACCCAAIVVVVVASVAADCLPWCTREDGQHVKNKVNELVLQILANWLVNL